MSKIWIRFVLVFSCLLVLTSRLPVGLMDQGHHHSIADQNSSGNDNRNSNRSADACPLLLFVKGKGEDGQLHAIVGAKVYIESVEFGRSFEATTTKKGSARVSNTPCGNTRIQVTAAGWKTYGMDYNLSKSDEPITILLDRESQ